MDEYFDSKGVQIRYVEHGQGEPVVLIHGFTDYIERAWIEPGTFDMLAENYHVIALDCRGHGKSGKPHDRKQYGREIDQDVIRLLDHLQIQQAHIVGYSMGGGITASVVTGHPERFLTATLGGSSGTRALPPPIVESLAAEFERGTARSLVLAVWPADQPQPTEQEIREKSRYFLADNDPLALAAFLRSGLLLPVPQADLAATRVPVLGVVGARDSAPLAGLRELKAALPSLTLVEIPGAGHEEARLRPEFGQTLAAFLSAHPGGRDVQKATNS